MIDILERWENTGLLQGIAEDLKAEMAFILENQIHHNEHIVDSEFVNIPQFRRISVPMARRVFPQLESHKKYNIGAAPYLESCLVTDLGVRGIWKPKYQEDIFNGIRLDREAKSTARLAETLKVRIDQFIESQAPFKTFNFQCFGTNNLGNVTLYYDIN
jgi:hypothetical protein